MLKSKFFLVIILIFAQQSTGSLIDNFISGAKHFWPNIKDETKGTELKQLPQVDFELPPEQEEFIKIGLEIIKAPKGALDVCSHRVVMNLKKNCNQLTLEEIGKLAIMLMNCQLEIENRSKLPCKPEMTLQQCLIGFDQNMYKIYNIMTNRAIAICSALKHDQFRALAEMTVNRLVQTSQDQVLAQSEALRNQRSINEMGLQNVRDLELYNEKIQLKQQKLIEELEKTNLIIEEMQTFMKREYEWQMKKEKQMESMAQVTDTISDRLDQTDRQMNAHYTEALDFLENFKSTMEVIAKLNSNIQNSFDKFQSILHDIGLEITADFFIMLCMNFAYFTTGMIFIIFLELKSSTYKNILIVLSIFNVLASYFRADVSIIGTNALIWTFYVVFYRLLPIFSEKLWMLKEKIPSFNFLKMKRNKTDESDSEKEFEEIAKNNRARSSTPIQNNTEVSHKTPNKLNLKSLHATADDSEMNEIFANSKVSLNQTKIPVRAETPLQRPMTPAMLRVLQSEGSFSERSATPFLNQSGRIQCLALTNKGLQCKNAALPGYSKCRVHNQN